MADTKTTIVARLKANLDTYVSAAPGGFGNDDSITTLRNETISESQLLAYRELLADIVDDYITVGSKVISDWQTVLNANDDKAYARALSIFDEILSSMEVVLKPIIRAVT
jgi:hypothetical protein